MSKISVKTANFPEKYSIEKIQEKVPKISVLYWFSENIDDTVFSEKKYSIEYRRYFYRRY